MHKKYLILIFVVLFGIQCKSAQSIDFSTLLESKSDFAIAISEIKKEALEILEITDSDSIEIKNFRINFTDNKDSLVYSGFINSVITSDTTSTFNVIIEEISSSFKTSYSSWNSDKTEVAYFKENYWAFIHFDYVLDEYVYSEFSSIQLPIKKN